MTTVSVTSKGQIAIPARIRKLLAIEKGTRLHIEERGEQIILTPLTADYLDRMAGTLKGSDSLSEKLLAEREADRQREH